MKHLFKKGYTPWNKGETKESNPLVKEIAEKRKGKKHSDSVRERISKNNVKYWLGKSVLTKQKEK